MHDLQDITAALKDAVADVAALKRLAIICMENPTFEGSSELHLSCSPTSPISKRSQTMSHAELWETNQTFEQLFKALMTYLQPSKVRCFATHQTVSSRLYRPKMNWLMA
jgi:CLIP-associating protein 1/2